MTRLLYVVAGFASLPAVAAGGDTAAVVARAQIQHAGASLIDVRQRVQPLRRTSGDALLQASRSALTDCSEARALPAPARPMHISPRYLKGNSGTLHPEYEAAVGPHRDFENHAARLANGYVATARPGYSHYLLAQLERWGQAEALLDYTVSESAGVSKQPWYQVEWTAAAAALALSQVMPEPSLDRARLAQVLDWLHRVSKKQIAQPGGKGTCCNKQSYWRGVHAVMVGLLTGDLDIHRWDLGCYTLAVDHLAADGSWPMEMARQELSMHYQNFALQPLVMIAEIAAKQGLDLDVYRSTSGQALHAAIGFLARNNGQPERWAALGMVPQQTKAFAPGQGDIACGEFYRARFGRDPLGLLTEPSFNARTGGNATLLAYRPDSTGATAPASIDLRSWKLQLPDASTSEVEPAQLVQEFRNEYFEVEPLGSLVFTAPVGADTSKHAKYTRSELLDPGDRTRNRTADGKHLMRLREEVLQAPNSGRVVVFQIHAAQPDGLHAPPLVKAQWHAGRMQFLVKLQASGGRHRISEVAGVPLKRSYDASLEVRDGRLPMQIDALRIEDDFGGRDPA